MKKKINEKRNYFLASLYTKLYQYKKSIQCKYDPNIFKYFKRFSEINIKSKLYSEIFLTSFLFFVKFMLLQILKLIKYSLLIVSLNHQKR